LALTLIIAKQTSSVFPISQIPDAGINEKGDNQPPKNKIAVIMDNHSILLYSAKKNIANVIDEYSTLYPATISA